MLSAGLAVVTLAPSFLQVGATAAGAITTGAFVVGSTSHSSSSSVAVKTQHHHHHDPDKKARRSFVGAITTPAAPSTYRCRALYGCCQPTTMGGGGKDRERRVSLSRRVRKLLRPLRASASASASSSAEGARAGLVSIGSGEQGKVRRSSGGGGDTTEYGGVDLTAPTEVQRSASIREQMVQMLRPDLPRVRDGERENKEKRVLILLREKASFTLSFVDSQACHVCVGVCFVG